jgi:hypothetical protein
MGIQAHNRANLHGQSKQRKGGQRLRSRICSPTLGSRGQFSRGFASRPQDRFHSRQPAVQRERSGRRKPAVGRGLEIWSATVKRSQLRLELEFHPSIFARRLGLIRSEERFNVHEDPQRRRDSQRVDRSRSRRCDQDQLKCSARET